MLFDDLFQPIDAPLRDLDRFFDRLVAEFERAYARSGGGSGLAVWGSDDELVLALAAPGVRRDDLAIEVAGNHLTLRGKRDLATAEQDVTWHLRERHATSWSRSITLPYAVDPGNAEADLRDGLLVLRLKRTPADRPRRIGLRRETPELAAKE